MRYLGVDLGERRTGLAISDPEGRMAFPHDVLEHGSRRERLRLVEEAARAEGVGVVVVGCPTELSGQEGESGRRARTFAGGLGSRGVRVVLWDERMTTRQARGALQEAGLDERGIRPVVDSVAAALILQSYLDHINHRLG